MKFALSLGCLTLVGLAEATPALAQIREDTTLSRPSVVTRRGNTLLITEGTQAGENLFHSFSQFSVPTGQTALFDNAATIENIFARVTGRSISTIDGQIRANGNANLFLLNPNGIVLAANASLNIGGSFLATTANSINFADGFQFSAATPQNVPLLTVSAPVGLQFGDRPGDIRDRSTTLLPDSSEGYDLQGLKVSAQTLALVGGDVTLPNGGLVAEQGRIEIGSVAGSGVVRLTPLSQGWNLSYEGIRNFGNIRIGNRGGNEPVFLYANGAGGGTIDLQGGRITLNNAFLLAETLADQNGAGISIRASRLELDYLTLISATSFDIGRGGDVQIAADQVLIRGQSQIETNAAAGGRGGNLSINANVVQLEGYQSGLFVRPTVTSTAAGQGGNLSIQTNRLSILAGAQISTTTQGAGSSGTLAVRALDIELTGAAVNQNGDLILVDENLNPTTDTRRGLAFPSGLTAGADKGSTGDGGSLIVRTQRLSLRDGAALQTSTLSAGDAGNLTVRASEIEVSGTTAGGVFPTGILSLSGGIPGTGYDKGFREATGRGGDLNITARNLTVQDGAVIASGSLNRTSEAEGAGNLAISARSIRLDDQANVIANTNSGNGGDITLRIQDLLLLQRGSGISTTAGIAGTGGNGGRITIDAGSGFIIAAPSDNSDITANAFEGNGGDIKIDAQVIGIAPQPNQTLQSDITATSERGVSGQITISNPEVDPTRGIAELPTTIVDASRLIARGCAPTTGEASRFIATGRGGLPLSPDAPLRGRAVMTPEWATLNSAEMPEHQSKGAHELWASSPENDSVEANGLSRDAGGQVVLVRSQLAQPVSFEIQAACAN